MKKSLASGGADPSRFGFVLLAVLLCSALAASACVDPELGKTYDLSGDMFWVGPPPESGTFAAMSGPLFVYLNFRGAQLLGGADNSATNTSQILGGNNYPVFSPSGFGCGTLDNCEQVILEMSQDLWSDWNIVFTVTRPSSPPYEMVMIGGNVGGGVAGVAPLDCGNFQNANISFAFSDLLAGSPCSEETVVTTIGQELAHALGLCHNGTNGSVMFPSLQSCTSVWSCGSQVDSCPCIGAGYDPFCPQSYLDDLLGPAIDDTPPNVSFVSPVDGSLVGESFEVTVSADDELGPPEVFLYAGGVLVGASIAALPYTWSLLDQPRGELTLEAWAWDSSGNMASASVLVEIVAPGDLGEVGDVCMSNAECGGGTFCAMQGDQGYCTDVCTTPADCPEDFSCDAAGVVNVCWPPEGWEPPGRGCGCRVGVDPNPAEVPPTGAGLLLVLAALALTLRRRTTR